MVEISVYLAKFIIGASKCLFIALSFSHQHHLFHADFGGLPYVEVAQTMELLASEVAPAVNAALRLAPAIASAAFRAREPSARTPSVGREG